MPKAQPSACPSYDRREAAIRGSEAKAATQDAQVQTEGRGWPPHEHLDLWGQSGEGESRVCRFELALPCVLHHTCVISIKRRPFGKRHVQSLEVGWVWLLRGTLRDPCGDRTVLTTDCGEVMHAGTHSW